MGAMSVVRWSRAQACRDQDPMAVDELDEIDVLVLDGVDAGADDLLSWCRRAPCVVVARHDPGRPPSTAVDVALVAGTDDEHLDRIAATTEANPRAARTLVDVLRVVERLDVPAGLVVESLAYSMLLAGPEFATWMRDRPPREPKTFERDAVRIGREADVLLVDLARPENRNAFSAEMRDGLVEALTIAEVDRSISRVVVGADGPVFSSGGDLAEFGSATDVVRAHHVRSLRSVGGLIARLPCRTEVRIRGACVGAGIEISAFADRLCAEPHTSVRLPEVAMGLIPGAGGTVSITRRIGRQRTALLALAGLAVGVDDALVAGLVDEVIPTEGAGCC